MATSSPIPVGLLQSLWRYQPNRVAVTFRQRTALTPAYTTSTVRDFFRRDAGETEAEPSQGVYLARDTTWYVPKMRLPDRPQPGDIVTHAGVDYHVIDKGTEEKGAQGCWGLHCRYFRNVPALATTVRFLRPTVGQDDEGAITATGATLLAEHQCGVRVAETFAIAPVGVGDTLGKFQQPLLLTAYLPALAVLRLQPHDYAVLPDGYPGVPAGTQFSFDSDVDVNQLGVLQKINLKNLL